VSRTEKESTIAYRLEEKKTCKTWTGRTALSLHKWLWNFNRLLSKIVWVRMQELFSN